MSDANTAFDLCYVRINKFRFKMHHFCDVHAWRPDYLRVFEPLKQSIWETLLVLCFAGNSDADTHVRFMIGSY